MAAPPPTANLPLAPPSSALVHPVATPLNAFSTPARSIDPNLNLLPGQVQLVPPVASSCAPIHAHPEPAFASHISQVFTIQMAREEELRETGRQKEATQRESKEKVQQTVVVYAWIQVCF